MKDNEKLIVEYLYKELPPEEMNRAEKLIATDEESATCYKSYHRLQNLLQEEIFSEVSDERLNAARTRMLSSLPAVSRKNLLSRFGSPGRELLKYAAVIAVTFFGVNYYNNRVNRYTAEQNPGIPINAGQNLAQEAAFVPGNGNYKVSNLDISREGEEIVVAYDLATSKVIRGTKDDPAVIYALDQLMKSSADPAVKLRTLKYVDKARDPKLQKSLLGLIQNDLDINVRRRALKILGNGKIDDEAKNVLLELVTKDSDQVMRIEALNILETYDLTVGEAQLDKLQNDDDELLRYKAAKLQNE